MSAFAGRTTRNFQQDHSGPQCRSDPWGYCPCPLELAPEDVADLVCSDVGPFADIEGWIDGHMPVIDLDLPCSLLPSGTPGNHHLYIDKAITFEDYLDVLKALARAGLVQWGFVNTTEERGFGALRHPDRPKAQ